MTENTNLNEEILLKVVSMIENGVTSNDEIRTQLIKDGHNVSKRVVDFYRYASLGDELIKDQVKNYLNETHRDEYVNDIKSMELDALYEKYADISKRYICKHYDMVRAEQKGFYSRPNVKIQVEEVCNALIKYNGNLKKISKALNINYHTLYAFINRNDECKKKLNQIKYYIDNDDIITDNTSEIVKEVEAVSADDNTSEIVNPYICKLLNGDSLKSLVLNYEDGSTKIFNKDQFVYLLNSNAPALISLDELHLQIFKTVYSYNKETPVSKIADMYLVNQFQSLYGSDYVKHIDITVKEFMELNELLEKNVVIDDANTNSIKMDRYTKSVYLSQCNNRLKMWSKIVTQENIGLIQFWSTQLKNKIESSGKITLEDILSKLGVDYLWNDKSIPSPKDIHITNFKHLNTKIIGDDILISWY